MVVGVMMSSTTSASSLSPLSASEAALFRVKRNGGDSGVGGPASSCFEAREGLAVRREERVETVVDALRELYRLFSPFPATGSDMSTSAMVESSGEPRQVPLLLLLARGSSALAVEFQDGEASFDRQAVTLALAGPRC